MLNPLAACYFGLDLDGPIKIALRQRTYQGAQLLCLHGGEENVQPWMFLNGLRVTQIGQRRCDDVFTPAAPLVWTSAVGFPISVLVSCDEDSIRLEVAALHAGLERIALPSKRVDGAAAKVLLSPADDFGISITVDSLAFIYDFHPIRRQTFGRLRTTGLPAQPV